MIHLQNLAGRVAAACIFVILLGVFSVPTRAELLEYVVALVDDEVVLASEFAQFKRIQRHEEKGAIRSDADLLESLILRRIQINRTRQLGISVSDSQFNQRLAELANHNNISTTQLLQQLENFPGGVVGWRNYLYENMLLEQFQRIRLQNLINVSEEDARNFLLTETGQNISNLLYVVAFVALPITELTDSDAAGFKNDRAAAERLEQIVLVLEKEGDFTQLAQEASAQYTYVQIRELEPSRLNQLPVVFSNRIPLMRVGDVELVERDAKLYLVKLLEVTAANPVLREEVRARHILLRPSILRNSQQTLVELTSLRERIAAGESFAELAQVFSEDSGSAKAGGTLGWLPYEHLDPSFAAASKSLSIGELSQPVESTFGLHLIEVLERATRDISEVTELELIRQHIFQQKLADELPRFLTDLRQSAFVEIIHLEPPG